jgi:hypothetical protein
MRISKRVPITVFIAAIAALSSALVIGALSAFGHDGGAKGRHHGGRLIRESLAPRFPPILRSTASPRAARPGS